MILASLDLTRSRDSPAIKFRNPPRISFIQILQVLHLSRRISQSSPNESQEPSSGMCKIYETSHLLGWETSSPRSPWSLCICAKDPITYSLSPIPFSDLDHIISCVGLFNIIISIPVEFIPKVTAESFARCVRVSVKRVGWVGGIACDLII